MFVNLFQSILRTTIVSVALNLMCLSIVNAQQPPTPCSTDEYRQFDFWLGTWEVHANGKLAGNNTIALAHNGCVLTEYYTTPSGYSGQSVNMYNAVTKQWHQTWVDVGGTLLLLDGNWVNGSMVLSGEGMSPTGQPVVNRITWTPNADGSVRQHWQARSKTNENNSKWQTVFDGVYTKQPQ